jgi:hypothetical protein
MKRALFLLVLVAGLGTGSPTLHSQTPGVPPAVLTGSPLEQLKTIRDQNAKLLQQQAATLQKLDEIEKTAQTLKVLGRRS